LPKTSGFDHSKEQAGIEMATLKSLVVSILSKLPPLIWWRIRAIANPAHIIGDDMALWKRTIPFGDDPDFQTAFDASIAFVTSVLLKWMCVCRSNLLIV
jgi:hypothetical protein